MRRTKSDVTWAVAARHLYSIDPRRYNIAALARCFGKNAGTMWWAIHPDLLRDHERDRYEKNRARAATLARGRYARRKANDPEFMTTRNAGARLRRKERKEQHHAETQRSLAEAA